MPDNWHSQDWLLIAEALIQYAGPTVETPRQCRAWELAEEIAVREDLEFLEVPQQTQFTWAGPLHRQ